MSDQTTRKSNNLEPNSQRSRRVLVVLPGKGSVLRSELIASGYETAAAQPESALSMVADYIPDVVIFELGGGPVEESDQHILALARRLRSEASTYALPLVFCDHMEDKSIRSSLIGLGADDYFSITTPIKETLARLDSLFWRIESGRRNASTSGDQRLDIDNFMLLLDSVRDDIRAGLKGTIGLIENRGYQASSAPRSTAAAQKANRSARRRLSSSGRPGRKRDAPNGSPPLGGSGAAAAPGRSVLSVMNLIQPNPSEAACAFRLPMRLRHHPAPGERPLGGRAQ